MTMWANDIHFSFRGGLFSDLSGREYYVDLEHRQLLIKSPYANQMERFHEVGRGEFRGRNGQRIILIDSDQALWVRRGHRTTLHRVRQRGIRNDFRYDPNFTSRLLEGEWHEDRGNERLKIESFGRHLEVIFNRGRHNHQHFDLVEEWDRLRVYRNREGDTITVTSDGQLTWRDKRGHHTRYFHRHVAHRH